MQCSLGSSLVTSRNAEFFPSPVSFSVLEKSVDVIRERRRAAQSSPADHERVSFRPEKVQVIKALSTIENGEGLAGRADRDAGRFKLGPILAFPAPHVEFEGKFGMGEHGRFKEIERRIHPGVAS